MEVPVSGFVLSYLMPGYLLCYIRQASLKIGYNVANSRQQTYQLTCLQIHNADHFLFAFLLDTSKKGFFVPFK